MSVVIAHQEHQACIDACVKCAQECEHCGDACIKENRPECARICIDCADICWTAAAFMSRGSNYMAAVCKLCADICDACAAECAKHNVEHCRRCAEVGRRAQAVIEAVLRQLNLFSEPPLDDQTLVVARVRQRGMFTTSRFRDGSCWYELAQTQARS